MNFNNDKINNLTKNIEKQLNEKDDLYALISLRTLLEEIVNSFGIDYDLQDNSLFNKIEYLKDNGYIDDKTVDCFHQIRMSGNKAVHENVCELSTNKINNYFNTLKNFIKDNKNTKVKNKKSQTSNKEIVRFVIILAILIIYWLFF